MTNRTISALLFTILLAFEFSIPAMAFVQTSGQDDPLLTLGTKPVNKDELIYLLSKGSKSEPGTPGMSREEFNENVNLFINYKLKVHEAEAQGLDLSEEFRREFESFRENLKAPFLIRNSLEEGELRKAYSRMQEIIRASHILLQFPPNSSTEDSLSVLRMALKIEEDIKAGGSINELAVTYSDDPSAQVNKGDLGYFTALQMVQPFEDAAFALQPGQVSDPVLTNFGYHIINVKDRQPNPGQVRVSHILIRINESEANGEDLAKRKVADIYTEIQKESTIWEDIVKNYSEDPASSLKGGMLPWFTVGSMIPEFEMAAFSLTEIGEVSPPIQTRYGYHILRLEEKRPIESFELMEENIRSSILRDSRSTMIQSQVMAIQKSRYNFDENETNVAKLKAELNTTTKAGFAQVLTSKDLNSDQLFTLLGKSYVVQDLADYMAEEEINLRSKAGTFDAWYERFMAAELNKAEEADLAANNKEYRMLLKEYRDGILLFSLMNEEVWQKGLMDSVAQKVYFEKNIQNYQWKNRVNAAIIKVLDMTQLSAARALLEGKPLSDELITSFENSYQTSNSLVFQTESGNFEYSDNPVLSKADINKSYQELEVNGHLHIVLIGEKTKAGPKKFEETRGFVIRDYQEYLDKTLVESLRKKYPVKINPKVKEETFIALNQ
ncbi:peptidyl-prolyl cis-trans isomerase SurA [Algoriphagus ratkowskyi]|uniref:Peptidyl-prolyl cis-trans isomerase SurA n=1 Tax=Algoriphagus ratkowskyi TaxID=57028 RepID=A0A2W7SA22_9BACT|nr:peptidylprolyl isomerase [Algoriphagus ratkowskyi]PZX59715.1 peptidyl-prolyl cis-trans isomerase SurA [Algoriphagus ratkowskyi]TXD78569.1 peptidylprolyl isomerase [Algoriphagus ratkowskyi]